MPEVLEAVFHSDGANQTLFGAGDLYGNFRVIVLLGDRAGGVSATCALGGIPLTLRESEVSTSEDGTARRGIFLFEGSISLLPNNQILESVVLDGLGASQAHCRIAIITDIDDSWEVIATNKALSGVSSVASQVTGVAGPIPEGDILLIAGDMTRGDTTKVWNIGTKSPVNPAGGTWDLQRSGGTAGNNARNISLAFLSISDFSGSSGYQDSVSYGTNRMSSALAMVLFSSSEGGTMDPIELGDGSRYDRIMTGLVSQGFTEGSISDRERARLLAKLVIPSTDPGWSLYDLYREAGEEPRIN